MKKILYLLLTLLTMQISMNAMEKINQIEQNILILDWFYLVKKKLYMK